MPGQARIDPIVCRPVPYRSAASRTAHGVGERFPNRRTRCTIESRYRDDDEPDGALVWFEHVITHGMQRIRAHLELTGDQLHVHANSEARFERVLAAIGTLDPSVTVLRDTREPAGDIHAVQQLAARSPATPAHVTRPGHRPGHRCGPRRNGPQARNGLARRADPRASQSHPPPMRRRPDPAPRPDPAARLLPPRQQPTRHHEPNTASSSYLGMLVAQSM